MITTGGTVSRGWASEESFCCAVPRLLPSPHHARRGINDGQYLAPLFPTSPAAIDQTRTALPSMRSGVTTCTPGLPPLGGCRRKRRSGSSTPHGYRGVLQWFGLHQFGIQWHRAHPGPCAAPGNFGDAVRLCQPAEPPQAHQNGQQQQRDQRGESRGSKRSRDMGQSGFNCIMERNTKGRVSMLTKIFIIAILVLFGRTLVQCLGHAV